MTARPKALDWADKTAAKHCLLETPTDKLHLDKWTVGPVSTHISIDAEYISEMAATRKWLAGLLRAAYRKGQQAVDDKQARQRPRLTKRKAASTGVKP